MAVPKRSSTQPMALASPVRSSGLVTGCEISRFKLEGTRCVLVHAAAGRRRTRSAFAGIGAFGQAFTHALVVNLPETMPSLSRRSFLAASAAAAARPVLAAPAPQGDVDVVIVGAGAAGIAAARRIVPTGRKIAFLEASERVGGRCFPDLRTF